MPHHHAWAQLAMSASGVVRLSVDHGTCIVPPTRADWIPPGVERAVSVIEEADLLRALALELDTTRDGDGPPLEAPMLQRECHLSALIFDELGCASASAFSAMVRRSMDAPPSRFFGSRRGRRVPSSPAFSGLGEPAR